MKSFFAVLLVIILLSATVAADGTKEIFGTVTVIDYQAKTFSVRTKDGTKYDFFANGQTDINIEDQNYRRDRFYQFIDLRQGDLVKVDYFTAAKIPFAADEIDVYR